jgi:hypothetical protein
MPPESLRTLSLSQLGTYQGALLKVQESGQGNPQLVSQALQVVQARLQELSGQPPEASLSLPPQGQPSPAPPLQDQAAPTLSAPQESPAPPPAEVAPPKLSGSVVPARPPPKGRRSSPAPLAKGKGRRFSAGDLPEL